MRSIELLLKRDMEIKIVSLPAGEDPDSYVHKYGREKFEELVKHAANFLEYQTAYYQSQGVFEDPGRAAEGIRDLVRPAALINDEKILKKTARTGEERKAVNLDLGEIKKNQVIDKAVPQEIYNLEKEIIELLLEGNIESNEFILKHLSEEEFFSDKHRMLVAKISEAVKKGSKVVAGSLIDQIEEENLKEYLLEITFEKYSISRNWDDIHPGPSREDVLFKYTVDTVKRFKVLQIELQLRENLKKLENSGMAESEKLLLDNMELEKQKKKIKEELDYKE
jgi:DNA primase